MSSALRVLALDLGIDDWVRVTRIVAIEIEPTDELGPFWNPDQSVDTARLACSMLHNGAPFEYVANHLATQSQAKIEEGRVFTATAMRTYPNCP